MARFASRWPKKPELPQTVDGRPRAFFGRRSGKRLHKGQDALFREVLPAP